MIPIILQSIATPTGDAGLGWLFFKTVLAMVIVIALAFGSIRFLLPRMTRFRGATASDIDIIGYRQLDARKAVYILRLRDREVAVGVTEHHITPITEWRQDEISTTKAGT
jgi:flagellar biogenesis protein FliO